MTESPRIFISYARRDGATLARRLHDQLAGAGLSLWQDRTDMEGGRDWWLQITQALDHVMFMVLVMTPGALQSEIVRKEWRYARQQGVCVYPVKGVPDDQIDFASLPRWMQDAHWYDLDQEWEKFVADLRDDCQSPRVPFMADELPDDFVPRPAEFNRLIRLLLDTDKGDPVALTVALRGAGGYGKTTLARAICHDEYVQQAFDDGILWVTLGENPGELIGRVMDLIYILNGERPVDLGLDAARTRLREIVADRDILLVIDDVWNPAHLKPFTDLGDRVACLITTRNEDTLPGKSQVVNVDAMQRDEAVALLTWGLLTDAHQVRLHHLAKRLGEWALLLKLVNGVLRSRMDKGQSLGDALTYIEKALDKRGLLAFDARNPAERNQAVSQSLSISLDLLNEDEQARYHELAIFPEDVAIPLQTVAKLWGATGNLDEFDTEELCTRLVNLSLLLHFDLAEQTIRLHDVFRTYLLDSYPAAERVDLHGRFLDAYALSEWADLPLDEPYLWDWLVYHLGEARFIEKLIRVLNSIDYLARKTLLKNAASVEADINHAYQIIEHSDTNWEWQSSDHLYRIFSNDGHILNRGKSVDEIKTALFARLPDYTTDLAAHMQVDLQKPCIVPHHPLPDLPHPALERTIFEPTAEVVDCDLHPHQQWVAAALKVGVDVRGYVKIYDLNTGETIFKAAQPGAINCVRFSPDGQWIAAGGQDNTLHLWHIESQQELMAMEGHTAPIQDCCFSPTGRWVMTASDDQTVKVWSLDIGAVVWELAGHQKRVWSCAISPNRRWLASFGEDENLIIWNAQSGEIDRTIATGANSRGGIAFSPDGQFIAAPASGSNAAIWEVSTGQMQQVIEGHRAVVRNVKFWQGGDWLVTCSSDSSIRIHDVASGATKAILTGHGGRIWNTAVSSDGRTMVSVSGDSTLKIWDIRAALFDLPPAQVPHTRGVRAVTFYPDGQRAVTATADNTLTIWEHATGEVIMELEGHNGFVNGVAVSQDGRLIASASSDYSIRVWDAGSGHELKCLRGHRGKGQAVAFYPDGVRLVSCAYDGTIRVWDWRQGQQIMELRGHERSHVQDCTLTPDGKTIISTGRDYTVRLWDAETGDPLAILIGHSAKVWGCDVSPDGARLATASWDGSARVWDLATETSLHILDGHRSPVRDCAWHPDGDLLLTVSNDRSVKVWDVQTGDCLATLHVDGELLGCAWHPDGEYFIATGRGGVYFLKLVR